VLGTEPVESPEPEPVKPRNVFVERAQLEAAALGVMSQRRLRRNGL
jgi:hypothetical protein